MSHLHVPDGILPVWLWAAGLAVAFIVTVLSLYMVRGMDLKKKVPLLGMMSAMMLVGMSLEIFPIAYHMNFSAITGIILGPWLAFIAALIVNILMALVGHGGITVVGLNTMVVGSEAVAGYLLFGAFKRYLKPGTAAGVSTAGALFISTCLMLLIVLVANVDFGAASLQELREHMESSTFLKVAGTLNIKPEFNFRLFAYAALGLGVIGWTIEALVTAAAVRFIARVKPELINTKGQA